ncbi:cell division protein ZapE [Rhizobiales bacterium GAS191]|nr:cell division protein ZapE [Rhizobiales bacterium GAS113]SEC22984.1 cell division protein ZapE [Rhizobiales bacterium GAS191]
MALSETSAEPHSVLTRYDALVAAGTLERDSAQLDLIGRLDELAQRLVQRRNANSRLRLARLFGRGNGAADAEALRGLYIYGPVGRGKTMLMDLFFDSVELSAKRRAHFNVFMADVHERIRIVRDKIKTGDIRNGDPIGPVAQTIAEESRLLCFDEFAVTDIADAMILGRLFTALFAQGVVLVATSNVEPDRLYEGGLNRALFLPFLKLLEERVETVRLEARADFRLEKLEGEQVWYCPADAAARAALDRVFMRLTGGAKPAALTLHVKGHAVKVPLQAQGVARFSFRDLCVDPLGASDYIALAQGFHTLIIDAVPVMNFDRRNHAKRFIALIDTLYERHVKLIASAESEPEALYVGDTGAEMFEFRRTASRLIEMRSRDYLALPHGHADSSASGSTTGLVET